MFKLAWFATISKCSPIKSLFVVQDWITQISLFVHQLMVCQDSVWADQSSDCPGVKRLNEIKKYSGKREKCKAIRCFRIPFLPPIRIPSYLQTAANELVHLNASISIAVHFLGIQILSLVNAQGKSITKIVREGLLKGRVRWKSQRL